MREPTTTTWRGTSRRAALRGAGLGLAGAAAVACSAPGGVEPPAASKAPVALSFMSWRPIAMDQFEPIWTEYGKKNNVTFDVDKSDDGNLTKLTTMFAADAGMDLFDASTGVMPRMYDSGSVLQLDKYLTRDKLTLDKEWAILGIERWRQKTYGVPYWSEPHAVYYNKTLFKQKGIEDPWVRTRNQGDWTLDEWTPPSGSTTRRTTSGACTGAWTATTAWASSSGRRASPTRSTTPTWRSSCRSRSRSRRTPGRPTG
jgi:ABC-type glycerol-3-phosphate transport system substrate-binding protein